MREIDKIIKKLLSNKIKSNITQKEYNGFSKDSWLNWLG